jgi:deoxyribodipyrimidine photo-lyase
MGRVPEMRLRACNRAAVRPDGSYVLYWMTMARRTAWNFGLQRAVEHALELGKPLVVLEALRAAYPWASERLHRFVLDGMADNAAALAGRAALYYPYIEPEPGAGKGLLAALAAGACLVVTDDFPAFFLPRMLESAARQVPVRLEAVDGNGLMPLRVAGQAYPTAYAFRRFLQKNLAFHLREMPAADPFARARLASPPALRRAIAERWPEAQPAADGRFEVPGGVSREVPAAGLRGGAKRAGETWRGFLRGGLPRYDEVRNHPDEDATSGLSPYLHFGHISAHQAVAELLESEGWTPEKLGDRATGQRAGWWGVGASAEGFLDQLVTWRELGFNLCATRADYDRYESLPDWARATLAKHARDPRPYTYDLAALAGADTHDPLWNAAQRQLVREGRLHNYLRMLWGKKILEWSASPEAALEVMVELNNKYALDGRDPNSYSGIFWCLGRYDRPWGPERPIFGTIRYMSSENTARKLRVNSYLRAHGPGAAG